MPTIPLAESSIHFETFQLKHCMFIFKSLLVHQLVEPVNWLKTIKNIFKEQHGATAIYEVGPGKQLRTMISRIDRTLLNNFTNLET